MLAELLAWGAMSDEQVEQDMKSMIAIEQACIKQESLQEQQMRPPSPLPPFPITTPMFDRPLPAEIVIHILSMLPFQSLIRCQQLNNTWRTIILCTPELWRNISFPVIKESGSTFHGNVYVYYLKRYLDNARHRLHSLKIQSTAMIAAILESEQVVGVLGKKDKEDNKNARIDHVILDNRCVWILYSSDVIIKDATRNSKYACTYTSYRSQQYFSGRCHYDCMQRSNS